MSKKLNSECWLLNAEGTQLGLCLPGEYIAGMADGCLPGLQTKLVVDRMGDMWFATFSGGEGEIGMLGGESIEPGGSCLLAVGENRLEINNRHFILRLTSDESSSGSGSDSSSGEQGALTSKHRRLLELFRDSVFHSGLLSEGMAKITFQAVEILDADRASLWLFDGGAGTESVLELRARFTESNPLAAQAEERIKMGPEIAERLRGITSSFLGNALITAEDPSLGPFQKGLILDMATKRALVVGIGGGTEECLGFLVMERILKAGEDWGMEEVLAAQGLAGLALHAIDARQKKQALDKLNKAETYLAAELKAAGNYIQRILPPPIPAGAVRADWCFLPSAQLGGDSFGYHWVGERFFVCYILDVVGHGSGAALLAISVSNAIHSLLLRDASRLLDPASVLSHLNASFPMEEQFDLTFSMWFGIFDIQSSELSFSSGGHPPAVLIFSDMDSPDKVQTLELGTEGVSVGSWADYPYANDRVTVPPNSKLFLYSDGAYEIPLENGQQWSFPEFVGLLQNTVRMAGGEVEYLRKRIRSLLGTTTFPDDLSILRLSFDNYPLQSGEAI